MNYKQFTVPQHPVQHQARQQQHQQQNSQQLAGIPVSGVYPHPQQLANIFPSVAAALVGN